MRGGEAVIENGWVDGWIEDGTDDRSSHFTQCVEISKKERERVFRIVDIIAIIFSYF